ncbi:hypothetical protein M3I54_00205 [Paraburkholderia sp. CNPSo 3274]|uniref:T4 family baseplate hub assembly chaperone n=1 Tax=Paraburkholderia sp. CNPSo 3274 TaxID=2940932 RepID=UPI0020B8F648|nr:hypothetical protein [Paraburkholderia sp. CNPSo 3274]MCP3705427.1 hypothetical protein [Paraburkholderia sp. CNPSo 3274]
MRPLHGQNLLFAWERGSSPAHLPALHRALSMLEVACPECSRTALAALGISARDRLLLQMREASFGTRLDCRFDCPQCGAALEFTASTEALQPPCANQSDTEFGAYRLSLREATSEDLCVAAREADGGEALRVLTERCVHVENEQGQLEPPSTWPFDLRQHAGECLETLHASAAIVLQFDCPACRRHDAQTFDAAAFVWREVVHHAQRLLDDVHALAWAYGWSEAAVLRMHQRRRQAYLDRAGL